ncbi:MAG: NADH-quinone oxidoreductase subunit K [Elusimicrobia bacterium]|nr:NADH-quinone oxidoreductase subunit K [Elusimicrobiota bacterium]
MRAMVWSVSGFLFASGLAMAVFRRQFLAMLFGLELMISAANIALVYCAGISVDPEGMGAAALIIALAAAEAVVGLSLILRLQREGALLDSAGLGSLRG